MNDAVIRSYEATVDDVKPGERSVVAKINTRGVDRHRSIIEPKGINLDTYKRNPVVLWEHGRDPTRGFMPIGRNKWITVQSGDLVAKTIFRDDAYSSELFKAYQEGDLRGWSINVTSHESGPPTREDERAMPGLSQRCDVVYRRTELAEYSTVCIPSNRDTLTILASRGIWIPDEAAAEAPPAGEVEATVEVAAVSRSAPYVDTDGQAWTVYDRDGQSLIAFADAGTAERCLRAMNEQRSFDAVHSEAILSDRAFYAELKRDVMAIIQLEMFGRV